MENAAERNKTKYYDLIKGSEHQVSRIILEKFLMHTFPYHEETSGHTMKSHKGLLVNRSKKPSRTLTISGVPGTGKTPKNCWTQSSPSLPMCTIYACVCLYHKYLTTLSLFLLVLGCGKYVVCAVIVYVI